MTTLTPFAFGSSLKVHYFDVGQGDSILIRTPSDKVMLIDAGPRSSAKTVVKYLNDLEIKSIDVLIATHPHEDHIGGFVEVFANFPVANIYLTDQVHTTLTYENFLGAVNSSGAKRIRAVRGKTISLDPDLDIEILSPFDKKYRNLNHSSIMLKLTFRKTTFLFTGDCELENEQELLKAGDDLRADVLKVGHHGSSTSSSAEFLVAVSPQIAVISSGKGNSYGHPHKEVVDRLKDLGIEILRVDQHGTIVLESDGNEVTLVEN